MMGRMIMREDISSQQSLCQRKNVFKVPSRYSAAGDTLSSFHETDNKVQIRRPFESGDKNDRDTGGTRESL